MKSVDEQLELIRRGVDQIEPTDGLRKKLEHSLKKQVKKDQLKETNLVSFKISLSLKASVSCALLWSALSETCSFLTPF